MVHFQGIWRAGRIAEQDEKCTLFCMAHDMPVYWFSSIDVVPIDRRAGTGYDTLGMLEAASAAFSLTQCLLNKEGGIMKLQIAAMHPEWDKENLKHCPWTRAFVHTESGIEPGHRALDNVDGPCGVIEIAHDRGELAGLYQVHHPRSGIFSCVKAAELRPYNIGDSSVMEAQAQAAQPTEFRLPSSADEMPVGTGP